MASGRVSKTIKNAKVGFIFYFLTIAITFFSRRIFLDCLGAEFIGLTGTLGSILSFLNVSEIGIATCIGYFLYKPIEQGDKLKICEIVSLFGWLYRIVGSVILGGGIIVSLFFPLIFSDSGMPLSIIYFTFYFFLASNLISYFINYRRILLDSDQKTYKTSIWLQTAEIVKSFVQLFLAYYYQNLYLWVAVEFIFRLLACWILNVVIDREYPWLKTNKKYGRQILRSYPEILVKTKQIVVHRLKNCFLAKCDEILIFAFESLQMVAYYNNYTMIVGKLTAVFNNILIGMNASIGNLVAEGNPWNIRKVFWEFATFRYWVTGIFIILLTFLINPVIGLWVGEKYILSNQIVTLVLINMYIMLTRPSVDLFINAYGLYDDVWAAYAEGLLNLCITLLFGYLYGLFGILLGKTISMLLLVVLWKPYYLFNKGFKDSVIKYWRGVFKHYTILLLCLALNYWATRFFYIETKPTFASISTSLITVSCPIIVLYSIGVFIICPGGSDLIHRLSPLIKSVKNIFKKNRNERNS